MTLPHNFARTFPPYTTSKLSFLISQFPIICQNLNFPTNPPLTSPSHRLGLNLIWMPLFFSLKRPILATVDIIALTGTVSYLTYIWGQVDSVAAWALAPYVGWLGFATYLSAGVGYLNDWNISDKEVEKSPKGKGTKYVDEKEE